MHAPTFLVTMAAAATTLVSAMPVADSKASASHTGVSPRAFWNRKKKDDAAAAPAPSQPATPAETCPTFSSRKGAVTATGDGHCCLPGPKNALNCCTINGTPKIDGTSELRCDIPAWKSAEAWQMLFDCNNHILNARTCSAERVPRLSEILRATQAKPVKDLNPAPAPKPAPPSKVPPAAAHQIADKPSSRPLDRNRQNPGKSRLGKEPNGNPAPAESTPAESTPAASKTTA
ncbi:hypothetical protein GGTG_08345 [Gaeumannomyces tritici R3-111a-1]|uniref:Extracellular membrane protein CFEM domain-containing protein n=1 Tax=Gaeumannomyces tritici (strain R3-111a-1) TaxID=644352 RepID=J3P4A9_GAET3|nr:hypothetical protein GGTG_08345 [Gaeumannomyces tritici R3-111a-1]EJT74505.1 hypothetical protein GGTG_08345 [Gaeumannomyces tritici R3-111a-1]